jgi:signal transduction histidine kinase/signal recognition particle receptor subunit beta
MVQFDNQYRQVKLKIVYYGPALGGKTTCLQFIHRITDPQRRTKLYALNTATDRTLFFDLLGIDLGRIRGYRLTLQLYTVPGQVQYNATRRAVLAGADGVVFVADSQRPQAAANAESMANLAENLRANGLDPATIPLVLQYNKRDLDDVAPRADLDAALNRRSSAALETVATTGEGVMEAFAAVTEATVSSVADRLGLSSQPAAIRRLLDNVRSAMDPLLRRREGEEVEAPAVLRPASAAASLDGEALVGEAVRANMAMTDLNAQLDRLKRDLEGRLAQLHSINEFTRLMTLVREPEEVAAQFLERLLGELRVGCGSLVLCKDSGELVEVQRLGLAADPLVAAGMGAGTPVATALEGRQPYAVSLVDLEPAQLVSAPWLEELSGLGLSSALMVPLLAQDRVLGLATAYGDDGRELFEEEEQQLAGVFASSAAVALANARAWRQLQHLNRTLKSTVAERTRELEVALVRATKLADELEDRNLALESANRQLTELESLKGDLLNRVAHELNTPVTSIQTAARILTRYAELPPAKTEKFVSIIQQDAGRLAELIASALEAAVLGVGEGPPPSDAVPVTDLLKRAIAPLKEEIGARSITVQVKVAAGLVTLEGDAAQLEAALRAVLKNAVEFNSEGGSVVITVRPVRRNGTPLVELRVEDSGVGISAEDLPHVCEVFWQGGNVLTEKPRGLGLGLAVARRVAENHGGMVEVSSEPGKGTTVGLLIAAGSASR